jgi:Domain of unknown function (DUF4136)
MKPLWKLLPGPIFLLCLSVIVLGKVTTDYDHNTDFSKYKTYRWIREPETRNPLMKDRIMEFIDMELNKKHLTTLPSGEDLNIAAHAATKEHHSLQTFYDGMEGWGWRQGFGTTTATTTIDTYEVGTLVVDIFDANTKQVVWRGVATETLSDEPEKNTKKLQDAIEDMFKKFPPKDEHKGD